MELEVQPDKSFGTDVQVVQAWQFCRTQEEVDWWVERFNALKNHGDLPEYAKMRASAWHYAEANKEMSAVLFDSGVWRYTAGAAKNLNSDLLDLFQAIQDYYSIYGHFPTELLQRQVAPF